MNNLSRALAVALMVATVPATIVVAQQVSQERRGPSPETLARMQDGRIAFAKAALKLTPEQEKLWTPVEEKIRANFEERQAKRAAWQAKRDERRQQREEAKAKGEEASKPERLALPDRIEKRSERLTAQANRLNDRAAKSKDFAEALKPLYATFSEEQRTVATRVLGRFADFGGRGHKGPRWAMNRDGHDGHRGPHRGHDRGPGPDKGAAPDIE